MLFKKKIMCNKNCIVKEKLNKKNYYNLLTTN